MYWRLLHSYTNSNKKKLLDKTGKILLSKIGGKKNKRKKMI
jgi:hypothetical protein